MQLFRALEAQQQQLQACDLGQREFSHGMTNTSRTLTRQARKQREDNRDISDFLRKRQLMCKFKSAASGRLSGPGLTSTLAAPTLHAW